MQEDEERISVSSIAFEQVGSQALEGSFEKLLQALFYDCHLPFKSGLGQLPSSFAQMDRLAEQGLHFLCPSQVRPPVDQSLQVADLVRQADLAFIGGCIQLRFPAVTHPHFCLALAHECINDILSSTGHNRMIFTVHTHENPFPPIDPLYTGPRFVTANHFALAHLLANRFGFVFRRFACTLHNRNCATFAQRNPKDFFTDLTDPLKSKMMFVMQIRHQRLQARPKLPSCFQTLG
jgi:hypothetical protein